jgi:hypothetical protein
MKKIEIKRSLFETLKKILEPIKYSKINFSVFFIVELWNGFYNIFMIVIMSYIIKYLEIKDIENLYFW